MIQKHEAPPAGSRIILLDEKEDWWFEVEGRRRLKWLLFTELPAVAKRNKGFPIVEGHCYARVGYDCAVGDKWNRRVKSPAIDNLTAAQVKAALGYAQAMLEGGADTVRLLNQRSLAFRGKTQGRRK